MRPAVRASIMGLGLGKLPRLENFAKQSMQSIGEGRIP